MGCYYGFKLARAGHDVVFFEQDVSYYATHRDLQHGSTYDLVLYANWDLIRQRAWEEVASADSAIVTSYCPDAVPAAELILNSAVPVRVFYDLDTPVTLERLRRGEKVDYIPPYGLEPFDLVLSYTGGRALDELRNALTPQCFRYTLLRRAYEEADVTDPDLTDESSLVERLGIKIAVVEGSSRNIKITREEDLIVAEAILKQINSEL